MRIYPRKKSNGERVWWASWTEGGVTKRRSTRCSTRQAAELVVARWERERADPVYAAANAATLGDEARLFLQACKAAVERGRMTADTLSMYRQKSGALVRILGADLRLAEIDAGTFASYLDARRDEGIRDQDGEKVREIQESTLYKEWIAFSGILGQAWRAQRFGRDPRSLKPAHFGPEYAPRKTTLTWEQIDKLLDVLNAEHQRAVGFAIAIGPRRKEVFAAREGDVDTKTWMATLRGTKTKGAARTVPVPKPMRGLMRKSLPPFRRWPNARRDLARACKRAGVPVVTWNDLRRTFASLLVRSGVAPHVVARLLGHTTTAMVDRVYGRTDAGDLATLLDMQIGARRRGPKKAPRTPKPGRSKRPRREPTVNQTRRNKGPRHDT